MTTQVGKLHTDLDDIDTVMLDMDGTLLDLAYDNYMWLDYIPKAYARENDLDEEQARRALYERFMKLQGKLSWYCLDHWSEALKLDIEGLHREQNQRIGYLPGAQSFLEELASSQKRVLLVTNSHETTLQIKTEVTDIVAYFDEIYTSHAIGAAKEDQPFWEQLHAKESFDPARTVFIDDNLSVLNSARQFGLDNLLHVTQPDSTRAAVNDENFNGIQGVSELVARD